MKLANNIALLAACIAFALPSQSAKAGSDEAAIIGGLIGGLIIGAAIADDSIDASVSVGYHSGHHSPSGYWSWVTVKTWVPGYYERSCDRYGRTRKVWISGHYQFAKQRVWIDSPRHVHGHPGKGRYDRHDHRWDDRNRGDHRGDRRGSRYAYKH